jgi:isopenicillin N synthase-like dioxygenase
MYRYRNVPSLPIIDLSLHELGDPWRDHVAAQLDWAAAEFGAFYLVGHGVDTAVTDAVVGSSQSFFRMTGSRGSPGLDNAGEPRRHLKLEGDPSRSKLLGDAPELRHLVSEYVQTVTGLAHKLMGLLGRALRLGPSYFADRISGSPARELHIIESPASAAEHFRDGTAAQGALFTLTHQSQDSGLALEHPTGWIRVPHVHGSIVVTIEETLQWLTRDRYRAPLQRRLATPAIAAVILSFLFKLPHGQTSESLQRPTSAASDQAQFQRRDGQTRHVFPC